MKTRTVTGRAIAYTRVSTGRQAVEGMSLDAQEDVLRRQAELLGFSECTVMAETGRSGRSISGRPALRAALAELNAGQADALVIAKIDRLARLQTDALALKAMSDKYGWRLIILDVQADTATPGGTLTFQLMAMMAEYEGNVIAERQRTSHAERRRQGQVWGVTHGPRSTLPTAVREQIVEQRSAGVSLRAIAEQLNATGVPTATGKAGAVWHASTVAHVLRSPATVTA